VKRLHLVCNAHIDPVWLWEWPEGAGEALSTFRTAAEFCERFRGFVFCHNEAILYRWVEEYEPSLFRRIQALVRKGRWNILGGWYLQPDCNMPSGESFIRQILLGKSYFREKFGVDARTAANLDPFGHTRGLVQIMVRCGYDSYVFCRPDRNFLELPADDFLWVGFDGSEIRAVRVEAHYNSPEGGARAKVEKWLESHPGDRPHVILWGIGDHGGGASRRDLEDIQALMAARPEANIRHSTAEAYFKDLAASGVSLPRVARDLNPWAVGCYTTMARVKKKHRELENEIYAAEKMAASAAFQSLMKYPSAELGEALKDLLFAEFHDILPGSSIGPGEEGAVRLLDHGLEIVSRVKGRAFFALAAGETPAAEGEIPIFVYNPHPFKVRTVVECEFEEHEPNFGGGYLVPRIARDGRRLPCQPEKELSNLSIEWRKKAVFEADLEPGCLNRFSCRLERIAAAPSPRTETIEGAIRFANGELEIAINAATGLIDRFRVKGTDFLAAGAFRPVVLADNADPWGMSVRRYRDEVGAFTLLDADAGTKVSGITGGTMPSVRVIEDGDVRTVVEAVLGYGRSSLILTYALPKKGTEVGLEARVFWNEKDRMLKLSLPTLLHPAVHLGQVAYGVQELPGDGDEAVSQKWCAVVSREANAAVSVINDGSYGSDCSGGELRLSLVRSPAHAADPGGEKPMLRQDRFTPRIDQGERVFRFWINAGPADERLEALDREALVRNEKPYVLPYFPPGKGKRARPFAALGDTVVQLAAAKKAERGPELILRLFEPTGLARTTTLALPFAGAETRVALKGFEIKTLAFHPKTKKFREVDPLERRLP
jgi:alpha-mannosidase